MAYFALPYRVLWHDTLAQGSHHFLTNFKFQCEAREHFYLGLANEPTPAGKVLLETLDLVTLDAYSRNLAPVPVGETVGILMSVEDQTPSSFRLCFRIVRRDGQPVACGFQSVLCTVRQTGEVMVSPEPMHAFAALKERSRRPSFRDRVLAGGAPMKELFDEEAVRIAVSAAAGYAPKLVPDILLPPADHVRQRAEPSGIVFLFPGLGSWDPAFVRSLRSVYPNAVPMLERMDRVAASLLGHGFLAACDDRAEAARLLNDYPDVAQVGIFAAGVVAARYLIDRGVHPTLLVGHSFGELTSLAVGGALDEEAGAELVCQRVRALQGLKNLAGGMLAVCASETGTREIVERLAPSSLEIAIINHAAQTVVSGTTTDLERLSAAVAHAKLTGARLKSRYPFHSPLLRDAVGPFSAAIARLASRPLHTAVYSSIDGGLYARVPELTALAHHFVRPAIFDEAVESAYALGGRVFVECSGGKVLSGLIEEILRGRPGVQTMNTFAAEVGRLRPAKALSDALTIAAATRVPEASAAASAVAPTLPTDGPEPIAIVATGCVLPGAGNPKALWWRLLTRQGGIVDLGELDPTLAEDFKTERRMTPDKTYSLLCGHVNVEARHADEALHGRLDDLPTVGRFFAQAASQCVAGVASPLPPSNRICCVIGSTADGSRELDEAFVVAGVEARINASQPPDPVVAALSPVLGHDARWLDAAGELSCPRAFGRVSRALFGPAVSVLAVDAACASSLYAIEIGVDALRGGRCDVAVCGGAFAPGPASCCLFAQFQQLSALGSRPLDASADGVVFGEGAALVMLKRLSDAVAAGDRIHAVIRAVASSSDGESASVMAPTPGGQLLAIRRAAERGKIPPSTLQFIDAHATATPVGDAVEFTALREAVGPPAAGRPRVRVGSLTAAIGHTGWVAGAASVVEVCQALEARALPPQLNFSTPNPKFNLEASNIAIQADPSPWPSNADGLPRRAGINGFGFGGCNAHVVIEEFDKEYHVAAGRRVVRPDRTDDPIAIIGISSVFPKDESVARSRQAWRFTADEIRLSATARILPDVADHLDAAHVLAIKTAQSIVESLPKSWESLRSETGVVIGFDGKTRRAIDALLPIYRDRLARRFREAREDRMLLITPHLDRTIESTLDTIDRMPRSGPHTLSAAMPNVTAGRVANVLNLNGPNLVLDAEGASLYQALAYAERQLRSGACRCMFAGGISSSVGPDVERIVQSRADADGRPLGEAAIMLGLTAASTAKELGLPILGFLSASDSIDRSAFAVGATGRAFLMGAEGALEIGEAVAAIRKGTASATVRWETAGGAIPLAVTLTAAVQKEAVRSAAAPASAAKSEPPAAGPPLIIPLRWATPRWVPAPARSAGAVALKGRRVLVLTDQPTMCLSPAARVALGRFEYRVVCPSDRAVPGGLAIDLATDAQATRSLQQLDAWPYDAIVILANVDSVDPVDGLTGTKSVSGGLLDLMFVVSRHAYERLGRGDVVIGAICLNAVAASDRVHPLTGFISGFLRSLVIELPAAPCIQINVSGGDLGRALDELEAELAGSASTRIHEVCVDGGQRFVQQLAEGEPVSAGPPILTRDSVVVATGGARGVTAVLVETIRREFGCTTVLVGRTDPAGAPADILTMADEAFDRFESAFDERELQARSGARPGDLEATYRQYRAVREAAATLAALAALPGAIEYIRADVTDGAQVDSAIQQTVAKFGRIDLIVHGAGIQTSKALREKRVEDFRSIVSTKLGGLGHLIHACRTHLAGQRPHWHLVTSTFSHWGNDGQQEYGAANLAMDRLAAFMKATDGELDASTLGWIGWVTVGMTKGSEYANLAIQRRLGWVTREKGKACFRQFIAGRPTSPVTYVITDLELAYFGASLLPAWRAAQPDEKPQRVERTLVTDTDTLPFLRDHTVNAVPTLPPAFGLERAARVTSTLRPGLDVERYLDIKAVERSRAPDLDGKVAFVSGSDMAVKPVPDGYPSVTTYLIVRGAARALEFYKTAFDGVELMRLDAPGGLIGHAEVRIGNTPVMLADENPEWGVKAPQSLGGSPVHLLLYVDDCDAVFQRAIAAGGTEVRPIRDQFYGDRSGTLTDPFGHQWTIASRKEDLTVEEIKRRAEEAARAGSGAGAAGV